MANDYGYFGSGYAGYAHYMASIEDTFGPGGGGGGKRGGGCLTCIAAVIGMGTFLAYLIR